MSILEVDIIIVHLFFLIFHFLGPKFEIRLKYFLDKYPKSSHCGWLKVDVVYAKVHQKEEAR